MTGWTDGEDGKMIGYKQWDGNKRAMKRRGFSGNDEGDNELMGSECVDVTRRKVTRRKLIGIRKK